MTEWPLVRLGDIAADEKSAISKPYGSAILREDYRDAGVPVVRGVNLARGRFYDDEFVFISEELADRMPGARLQSGDLVFTPQRLCGSNLYDSSRAALLPVHVVHKSSKGSAGSRREAIPEFFYYWFLSPAGRHSILQSISTVGVPGLARPVETIKSLLVPLPPLDEQRRIAGVLGALDDLIDVNQSIRTTLDLKGMVLVEDLVLRQPDWDVVRLGDAASVIESGRRPRGGVRGIAEGVPSIGAESIDGLGVFDFSKTKFIPADFAAQMRTGVLESRDVLIYKDGGKPGDFRPTSGCTVTGSRSRE